jgi:peptidoglycan/LPS O-acetylase OafA/YrhL
LAYLAVAAGKHFAGPGYNVGDFIVSALLLQVWVNYVSPEMNHWNPPSWSISAEFWTYLLFSIVISIMQKRAILVFAALIAVSILFLVTISDRYVAVCFSGGGFFRCIFGFSFGVLSYFAYQRWPITPHSRDKIIPATLIEATGLAIGLGLVSVAGAGPWSLICPPIFATLILIFANERGIFSRLLLSAPMRFVGGLSYSIYMVHEFVLARFVNLIGAVNHYMTLPVVPDPNHPFALTSSGSAALTDIAAIVAYILVIVVSYLTYTYVESPCRRWSRRLVWLS